MYLTKMKDNLKIDVRVGELELAHRLESFYQNAPLYKLATKQDVENVINETLSQLGSKDVYSTDDFYSLVQQTDAHFNFPLWQQMNEFLSNE